MEQVKTNKWKEFWKKVGNALKHFFCHLWDIIRFWFLNIHVEIKQLFEWIDAAWVFFSECGQQGIEKLKELINEKVHYRPDLLDKLVQFIYDLFKEYGVDGINLLKGKIILLDKNKDGILSMRELFKIE